MKTMMRCLVMVVCIIIVSNAQWVQTSFSGGYVSCLAFNGSNLFAGTWNGVFRSTDNGTSWIQTSLDSLDINAIAFNGTNLFVGTWGGRVFLSTNNGTNWIAVNTGLPVDTAYTRGNTARAVSAKRGGSIISSFADIPNESGGTNLFAAYDCGVVGAYPCDGVYLSTNNGTSWTQTSLDTMEISTMVVSGKNLFSGTYFDGVHFSGDNGINWTPINNGLTNTWVISLAVSGENLFAGTDGGVFLSTNNGTSWTAVNTGLTNTYVYKLAISGTNLFAGTSSGGVFLSTNNGTSWTASNTGLLLPHQVCALTVFGTNLFVSTGIGIWRRPLSEMITDVQQSTSQLPEAFSISQNFPNPFNPSTTLRYCVPERSTVRLSIFNILGQKISEIINETKDAGSYEQLFNSSQLSSGIYFYRIEATSTQNTGKTFMNTKKMILMR